MSLKIYDYNGSPIQFEEIEGRIMANATLMAMAFKKEPGFIFKTKSWKVYLLAVEESKGLRSEHLQSVKNGENGGSWIHQELVIEFARRLNPKFSIWCNDKIAELLRTGKVELNEKSESERILDVINLLQAKVEYEIAEKEKSLKLIGEQAPKVQYYDEVLQAENLFPITLVAQQMGMTAQKLNKTLLAKGVQRKVSNTWVLTAAYVEEGYASLKTFPFNKDGGGTATRQQLYWTEKGKEFIMNLLGKVKNRAMEPCASLFVIE
jgi:phage antirepressor YoqD-like protein